mgnify:CR=1 FL=1
MIKRTLFLTISAFLILCSPFQALAQQNASPGGAPAIPPTAQQAVNQGLITPQQVQEGMKAVERGQISPEAVKRKSRLSRRLKRKRLLQNRNRSLPRMTTSRSRLPMKRRPWRFMATGCSAPLPPLLLPSPPFPCRMTTS